MEKPLRATVTLHNYRCFGDTKPAVIELQPGLTGFVGPNNSGKSTILRAFREPRNVFGSLNDQRALTELAKGAAVPTFNYEADTAVRKAAYLPALSRAGREFIVSTQRLRERQLARAEPMSVFGKAGAA